MDPLKLINGDADVALAGHTQHLTATTMKSTVADNHPQLEHGGGALQTGIKPKPDLKHLNLATSVHGRGPSPATTPAIAGEGRERGQSAQIWRGTRRTGKRFIGVQEYVRADIVFHTHQGVILRIQAFHPPALNPVPIIQRKRPITVCADGKLMEHLR
jgi:hypothetical protein